MWWGRGDTSRLGEEEKLTLEHLRRLDETGHLTTLNAQQAAAAIRAVAFFGQWESVLRLMTSFKNVALLVGALLAIYWASEGWIISKIAEIAGGG